MAAEPRAVLVKLPQIVFPELPERPQGDIVRAGRVPLGEYELVRRLQHAVVEGEHQVEAREIAADVADPTLVMHPQQPQISPPAEFYPPSGGSLHDACFTRFP